MNRPGRVAAVALGALGFAASIAVGARAQRVPAGGRPPPAAIAAPATAAPLPMDVVGVMPTDRGNVVLLRVHGREVYLPIWIGDNEAIAIHNRLQNSQPPRPMTHDLLETMLRLLGARIVRVDVVALREEVFYGEVTLREPNGQEHRIDARSSDSIALALGARAPIFAAASVVGRAGIDRRTLETNGYQGTPIPPALRQSL